VGAGELCGEYLEPIIVTWGNKELGKELTGYSWPIVLWWRHQLCEIR